MRASLNLTASLGDSFPSVLVIVNQHDHTVTPASAIEFARLLRADLLGLDDHCGHQ